MYINAVIAISLLAAKKAQAASVTGSLFSVIDSVLDTVVDTMDELLLPHLEPAVSLDFLQLAAKYGFPAEEHVVYTEDGYRLKVFHIPGRDAGYPILLFHGFTDSADTWIIRGDESLAVTLAKQGRDLWLGNVRGNKYSLRHPSVALDQNATFWNFTFDEYGRYDLPRTMDLVLSETGADKLDAIVHSQGSTMFFVLLSSRPEYNDKVNLLVTLAPVAFLQRTPPPLGLLLRLAPELGAGLALAGQRQVFSETSPTLAVVRLVCSTAAVAYAVCLRGVLYQLVGADVSQIDPAFSLVVFGHAPTATSVKNLLHFGQVAVRKEFARYDYGARRNLAAYGSEEPPEYPLERVRARVVLLTARNDRLSTQGDVALLRARLPNVVRFVVIPRPTMNHLDFVWGQNMSAYLFPYILQSLKEYGA